MIEDEIESQLEHKDMNNQFKDLDFKFRNLEVSTTPNPRIISPHRRAFSVKNNHKKCSRMSAAEK